MADVTFKDFVYNPSSIDNYIVGYDSVADHEIKIKISDISHVLTAALSSDALTRNIFGSYLTSNKSLSTNGVETVLKIRDVDTGQFYGIKVEPIAPASYIG
jgi:hypothetical protein